MTYKPGDEYRRPMYARRGWWRRRWECCVMNKHVGFGLTKRAALRRAMSKDMS